jgi:DNA-binding response OmpR family regulator
MPGMNGFDLLHEIRAIGADVGGGVAVIAMSSLLTDPDRARILNAGFQACSPKPFAPDKLLETIVALCGD